MSFLDGAVPDFIASAIYEVIGEACTLNGIKRTTADDYDDQRQTRATLESLFSKPDLGLQFAAAFDARNRRRNQKSA